MNIIRLFFPIMSFFLIGCNGATLSPDRQAPIFSSGDYEHLDCYQLKKEVEKLDVVIKKLSDVKNESKYVLHTEMPFVGTGDSMGAVELIKSRAERNAIRLTYEHKECGGAVD